MRRLFGLKDSANTPSFNTRGKERQQDSTFLSTSSSSHAPMEVHVNTEVHSALEGQGSHPLSTTTALTSPSPASSDSLPLPPEIRVPTHPYPYWQGYTHTPSSSSQSSLESPMTPSHVSWLNPGNVPGNPDVASNGSNTNFGLTNPALVPRPSAGSSASLVQGRSSPSPHFPPPPPTNPPPNISTRPKFLHPTKSTHSLRVPVQEFFNQQLSPIVEQDYISPEKRPISLPSSSHEGGGSRSSTAHTARTSAAMMTPVSPVSDGAGGATVTPVSPVPITPVLVTARGTPSMPQTQVSTPVTPLYPGGVIPFARRKEEESEPTRKNSSLPSPVSTFILRPLNRSISLSSTRTHQSSASSVTPPVIPPLDLRPEFRGQAFLTTPTSLNSRGLLDSGAQDDESISDRRASFVTAQTRVGRESKYSVGQEDVFVDAEEGFRRDSNGTIHASDPHSLEYTADTPTPQPPRIPQSSPTPVKPPVPARTAMHPRSVSRTSSSPPSYNHPSGMHNSDNQLQPNLQPQPQPHLHRPTPFTMHPSRSGVSAPSLQDLGTSISTSSSFVDRRFAPSSLYLPPASEREFARKAGSERTLRLDRLDTVQVLFWFGFIAPWCWLIGGWLISKSPSCENGSGSVYGSNRGQSSLLPLLANRSKSVQSLDMMKTYHGYPFVAPSASSFLPQPLLYQSQREAGVLMPKPIGFGRKEMMNPWVRRCRIAAVASGMLVMVAFVVALVVVGSNHSI